MSSSPFSYAADSQPCNDAVHGEGFAADVERSLCKEPKRIKPGFGGKTLALHPYPPESRTWQSRTSQQALRSDNTTAYPKASPATDKKISKSPKKVFFATTHASHAPHEQSHALSATAPAFHPNKPNPTAFECQHPIPDFFTPGSPFYRRLEAHRKAIEERLEQQSTTPYHWRKEAQPAALSDLGRKMKALKKWEEVDAAEVQETEVGTDGDWERVGLKKAKVGSGEKAEDADDEQTDGNW